MLIKCKKETNKKPDSSKEKKIKKKKDSQKSTMVAE